MVIRNLDSRFSPTFQQTSYFSYFIIDIAKKGDCIKNKFTQLLAKRKYHNFIFCTAKNNLPKQQEKLIVIMFLRKKKKMYNQSLLTDQCMAMIKILVNNIMKDGRKRTKKKRKKTNQTNTPTKGKKANSDKKRKKEYSKNRKTMKNPVHFCWLSFFHKNINTKKKTKMNVRMNLKTKHCTCLKTNKNKETVPYLNLNSSKKKNALGKKKRTKDLYTPLKDKRKIKRKKQNKT
ncbi:hypothetical protein RFI_23871 [Reticulomyxa filosa]|uniref:Uncharacterized protein n=1 Tax=Reticulomyxa filosa TaxID=46433 RepID=X6MIL3_RETFI|nr:hypothetical protein RFI_23871 [Reticulomyxa filosa]|eukprot:ETO13496.1 hypothetical protein RFI_23871 [Reticulomyxa filosa]